jgi:hypothetical protein
VWCLDVEVLFESRYWDMFQSSRLTFYLTSPPGLQVKIFTGPPSILQARCDDDDDMEYTGDAIDYMILQFSGD